MIDPTAKIKLIVMPFNDECYNLSSVNVGKTMADGFRIHSPMSGSLA